MSRRAPVNRPAKPEPPQPTPRQRAQVALRFRASSVDECPRRIHSREYRLGPATGPSALPPRSSFQRLFARRCSRMFRARPFLAWRGCPASAKEAARCSPTSTIESLCEQRLWTIQNPAHRASSRPPSQLRSRVAMATDRRLLSDVPRHGQPSLYGPGVRVEAKPLVHPTPLDVIAHEESLAPPR